MVTERQVPEGKSKLTRLYWAMGAYAVLALLAWTTLDGWMRYGVWILLGGLAAKTLIAHKAGW
jgi:hypothetical protein